MSGHGLRVSDIAPVGERAGDRYRGRVGTNVAGVDSLLGIPMVGTLADGQVWVYDAATGTFIPGDPGSPNAELNIEGGQDVIKAHGSVGSTVAIDPTDGNIHTLTLTANCTATIAAPVGSGGADLILWVTQDGTGGWTFTVAATGGTVTDDGTLTPATTAGVIVRYITERIPGTTNDWIRDLVGGGGSALTIKDEGTPLATAATSLDFVGPLVAASGSGAGKTITVSGALDDLSDVVITSPAAGDRVRYDGSNFVNSALRWEPHVAYDGTVVLNGNGDPVMVEVI